MKLPMTEPSFRLPELFPNTILSEITVDDCPNAFPERELFPKTTLSSIIVLLLPNMLTPFPESDPSPKTKLSVIVVGPVNAMPFPLNEPSPNTTFPVHVPGVNAVPFRIPDNPPDTVLFPGLHGAAALAELLKLKTPAAAKAKILVVNAERRNLVLISIPLKCPAAAPSPGAIGCNNY